MPDVRAERMADTTVLVFDPALSPLHYLVAQKPTTRALKNQQVRVNYLRGTTTSGQPSNTYALFNIDAQSRITSAYDYYDGQPEGLTEWTYYPNGKIKSQRSYEQVRAQGSRRFIEKHTYQQQAFLYKAAQLNQVVLSYNNPEQGQYIYGRVVYHYAPNGLLKNKATYGVKKGRYTLQVPVDQQLIVGTDTLWLDEVVSYTYADSVSQSSLTTQQGYTARHTWQLQANGQLDHTFFEPYQNSTARFVYQFTKGLLTARKRLSQVDEKGRLTDRYTVRYDKQWPAEIVYYNKEQALIRQVFNFNKP